MTVRGITVGPFAENTYLVADDQTRDAVLIDPGEEPQRIIALVRESGATLRAIWLTHAHLDHIGGVAGVRREWPVPVFMHRLDEPVFHFAPRAAQMYGVPFEQPEYPESELAEGDVLAVGGMQFRVWHVPGHAPGHVVFIGDGIMLGGDLLFAGSIGRVDLPLSDPRAMQRSLDRLESLPDDLVVYPGHGPATTIGDERRTNPFLAGQARLITR